MKIVCYGGGVNGTAMLVELTRLGIIVDYILFADTGGEKPETYAFIAVFDTWLRQHGQPGITIVRTTDKDGNVITLEADMLKNGTIPPIAFGFKTCSEKFKQRPQEKFLTAALGTVKQRMGEKPTKYIGFDARERYRMKEDPTGKYINAYPLIDWGWDRARCIEEIKAAGLCPPPKSSCFFCPSMTKPEILELPEDLQQRAIAMEDNAKPKLMELKGLGRRFSWKKFIQADREQMNLFDDWNHIETPCECMD